MSEAYANSDLYWEQIGGKVLRELDRRLDTEEGAATLAGTLLMRLAEQYLKYLEKKAKDDEDTEVAFITVMEAIDQEGVPVERKMLILQDYLETLEQDKLEALNRLAELMKEQHGIA